MPSALENAARAWRQRLLAYEQAPMQQLQAAYEASWQRLQQEIDRYTQRIERGDPLLPGLLHRRQAAAEAQQAIAAEIERLNRAAEAHTVAMQQQAVGNAHTGVQEMVAAQDARIAGYLRRPNFSAVESLIGFASDGSPLADVLEHASRGQARAMVDLLAQNVALGVSPMVTARQMRDQFGTVLRRAQTIARTETVRAYREASHLSMEANDDVLDGWIWLSALSARTCVACFAMHGTFHPLSERLQDHPNGRCTAAPHVKGTPKPTPNGAERFRQLTLEQQRAALGNAKYTAWQDDAFDFKDLARVHESDRWGRSVRERSLTSLVGEEKANAYIYPTPAPKPVDVLTSTSGYKAPAHGKKIVRTNMETAIMSEQRGMSVADLNKRIKLYDQAAAAAILPEDTVHVRIRSRALNMMMAEDKPRFKSQFETSSSGGAYNNQLRSHSEEFGLDVRRSTNPTKRPIYGYVAANAREVVNYGDAEVVLKQSVRPRTSITFGDSLVEFNSSRAVGTPMNAPRMEGAASSQWSKAYHRATQKTPEAVGSVLRSNTVGNLYIEAQVHGGVTVEDFEKIIFHKKRPSAVLQAQLEKKGIVWEYSGDE